MTEASRSRPFLNVEQVADRYGVGPATIWRWSRSRKDFPKPIRLGENCTRWRASDLERWESEAAA